MKMPWETDTLPAEVGPAQPPAAMSTEDTVSALQRDFAYAMHNTAVLVHSKHEALQILVNTPRGQIIPRGKCRLTDGSTIEFQDIGMPQVGAPLMDIKKLVAEVFDVVSKLGLGVQS